MTRRYPVGVAVLAGGVTVLGIAVGCGLDVTGVTPSPEAGASSTASTSSASSSSTGSTASSGGSGSASSTTSTGSSSSTASSSASSSSSSSTGGPTCPAKCGTCPGGVCEITCDGTTACDDARLTCPIDRPCRVLCSGTDRCKDRTITCPPDQACEVRCNGTNACGSSNTTIVCGAKMCSIFCSGESGCLDVNVNTTPLWCMQCDGTGAGDGCKSISCTPTAGCRRHCIDQSCGSGHFSGCEVCPDNGPCPAL